ncbi:MAG: hypothetical protein BMS9Abin07_2052 [Acidimicrobiia bacterium]|nr:MAG: hypothetical protein BMS9Abin07_2052 [Acidimicrobiia bacterium]
MDRVKGFFIIIGALGPIIALVVLVAVTLLTVGSVTTSARTFGDAVGVEIADAKVMLDDVTQGFDEVGTFVSGLSGAVGGVADDIAGMPVSVSVPIPDVTFPEIDLGLVTVPARNLLAAQNLSANVPGAVEVKQFFGEAAAVSRGITDDLRRELNAIFRAPKQITNIAAATGVLGSEVRSAVSRWFVVVTAVLALALLGWIVGSMSQIVRETRLGWSMLVGQPVPAVTIDELNRRLRELQKQLAAYGGTT